MKNCNITGGKPSAVFRLLPAVFVFCSLFLSCVTAPKSPDPLVRETEYLPLEPGAAAYIIVDVERARPLLDGLHFREINRDQSKRVLDMTGTAVAAVYEEGPRRFQAAAWGKYPAFRAGLSFMFSGEWKKTKSPGGSSYWRSERAGLSLALNPSQAYVSDGDPFAAPPGTALPAAFAGYRRGAVLACWLPSPAVPLDRFLAATGLPLKIPAEEMFLGIFPASAAAPVGGEGGYEILIRIETPSASQARAIAVLIGMARAYLFAPGAVPGGPEGGPPGGAEGGSSGGPEGADIAALLFAAAPVQDGAFLNIRTAVLSETEVTLLLSVFSLY
ncbi:MAG: hypothetical protein LBL44_11515 [Treponema sp.]|nr:hypothetical protein [Treponema sp.]